MLKKNYFKWAKNGASKEFYEQESPESTAFQMTLPSAPFADFLRNELWVSLQHHNSSLHSQQDLSQLGTFKFKQQLCNRSSVAILDFLDLKRDTLIMKNISCM